MVTISGNSASLEGGDMRPSNNQRCRTTWSADGDRFRAAPAAFLYPQPGSPSDKEAVSILKQKCSQCHGEALQTSGLDLSTRELLLRGGEKGPVIVPGDSEASRLYRRVAGLEKPAMPMAPFPPLSAQQVAVLKSWIDQGANWSSEGAAPSSSGTANPRAGGYGNYKERLITAEDRKWWAFQKPVRHAIPGMTDARWNANAVDTFIKKSLDDRP